MVNSRRPPPGQATAAVTASPPVSGLEVPVARSRRAYHHGNLRAGLLDAAQTLLAEHGVAALTLREVARAAGVSHGAPYHHFAGLDELLAALAQRGFEQLAAAMAAASAAPDVRERLLRVAQAYVACAQAQPERFRLMFGPLLTRKSAHPALQDAALRAFGHLRQAALAFDPRRGDDLAVAGWSLVHGLSHLLIDGVLDGMPGPALPPDAYVRLLTQRLLGV